MLLVTLVLNVGSSSVKWAVANGQTILHRGQIDNLGSQARFSIWHRGQRQTTTQPIRKTTNALRLVGTTVQQLGYHPTRIVHRVVHGGARFFQPTKISPRVMKELEPLVELAPIHQPANLLGIEFAKKTWPRATQWAVFDTALYHHLPPTAQTYALPGDIARRLHIRKYGFHGISHQWAFQQAAKRLGRPTRRLSAVTMHLGSGASMTLWHRGRPLDTTMGFTPLEGLVMSTRSGDIDPAIPLYIQKKLRWTPARVKNALLHNAGLLGLSGLKDMRDVLTATGHRVPGWPAKHWPVHTKAKAKLALDIFCYHIRRTLAGYIGLIDDVGAIIFTGPVAENRTIQQMICHGLPAARGLRHMTIHADEEQAMVSALNA